MRRWQRFEADVLNHLLVGDRFTNQTLADILGVVSWDVSMGIQSYLSAQRAKKSQTRFVLVREGRTSNAIWTLGVRANDARNLTGQAGDDISRRLHRALEPDIIRLTSINPRARRTVESVIVPAVAALASSVEAVMNAVGWVPDDDE